MATPWSGVQDGAFPPLGLGRISPKSIPGGRPCGNRAYAARSAHANGGPSTSGARDSLDVATMPVINQVGAVRMRKAPLEIVDSTPSVVNPATAPASER